MIFPPEVRPLPEVRRDRPELRPAVFFDRDDTLIENAGLPAAAYAGVPGDLVDIEHIRLLPGAAEACGSLASLGYAVFIVTNQGVVARGGASIEDVQVACERTVALLGGRIEAVLACPFHPRASGPATFCREHPWRKPAPGMLLAAAELFGLDLSRSWMIGDAERDVSAGVAAGLPTAQCIQVGPAMPLADAVQRVASSPVAGHG